MSDQKLKKKAERPDQPESSGCPGKEQCAGCYSVGVRDGEERFIHPPITNPPRTHSWKGWV